jgi:hypothetical protein
MGLGIRERKISAESQKRRVRTLMERALCPSEREL